MATRTFHFLTVMAANKDLSHYFSKFLENGWRMAMRLGVADFYVEGILRVSMIVV